MYIEVMEFNKARNQLSWDMKLELEMLQEEIKEFWDGKTVADRLDALVDTEYVWIGTQIKASYNTQHLPDELVSSIRLSLGIMGDVLAEELGMYMSDCYHKARLIVCEINAMKGNKLDENGKVYKDGKLRNATTEISLMIASVTGIKV